MIIRFTGENFEHHWGFVKWRDKIILDIGADYGSTAECFLAYGAATVYATEGDEKLYNQLVQYANRVRSIIPIKKWISRSQDFVYLFNNFKCDIAKIDCEKAEINLLGVPDHIIRSIKEYAIECHNDEILVKLLSKYLSIGYNIINTISINKEISVFHAIIGV